MSIRVHCSSCNATFQVQDSLAGRKAKCPKCKAPITIGQPKPVNAPVGGGTKSHNPLLDLLDQENVKGAALGPMCPECGAEMNAGAVICVECGYNMETGARLETEAFEDVDAGAESTMSDAERIMAKAEREIEDSPVSSDQQNFGDGTESYLIAVICGIAGIIFIGIGLVIILTMDTISQYVATSAISFIASITMYIFMGIWISVVAFSAKAKHGIGCVASGFLYCIVFGFMQGKSLLMPTIIQIVCLVVGAASGAYTMYNGFEPKDAQLITDMIQNLLV
ncbi:MAG: hypothetical protein AAF939_06710 [Planctomycetota bacterium]